LYHGGPKQTLCDAKRTLALAFFGLSGSLRRGSFRCAEHRLRRGFNGSDQLSWERKPPRAFAGFGGESALAMMDAVVAREEFAGLITNKTPIMKKKVPMIGRCPGNLRQSAPTGRSARFRNMMYRIFLPGLPSRNEGAFFRCQLSGCMIVAMGDQGSPPSQEPAQGSP